MIAFYLVWLFGWVEVCSCVSDPRFIQFALASCCAHKRIVNIMKVYIERNNMHVELIRFRKQYRLSSRLRLERRYKISPLDSKHFNYPWNVATVLCTKLARKVLPRCAGSISANSTTICYSSLRFWLSRSIRDCEWTHGQYDIIHLTLIASTIYIA